MILKRTIRRLWPSHLHRTDAAFLGLIFLLFVGMSTIRFFSMNDQLENIFGGTLIAQGIFPYSGFFTQHMPLPHYIGAGLSLLTRNVWWLYQACFTFLLFAWAFWLYARLSIWTSTRTARVWLGFITVGASLTLGHTILAETFVAYASLSLVALFLFRYLRPEFVPKIRDAVTVSLLTFLIIGSSLLYAFFALLCIGVWLWVSLRANARGTRWRWFALCVGIFTAPYLLFILSLLLTHSTTQIIFDVYTFNQQYYAQFVHYPSNVGAWLLTVPFNFFKHAFETLRNAGQFFRWPDLLCTMGVLGAAGFFLRQRQYLRGVFLLASASLLIPRDDFAIALSSTTDTFHSAPYFFVAILGVALVLGELWHHQRTKALRILRVAWLSSTAIILCMLVAWSWYLFQFIQEYPDVRVRPQFSIAANALLTKDDFFWSGPGLYPDLLNVHAKFAAQAFHYFPWQAACNQCTEELLADLTRSKPSLIVFEKRDLTWQQYIPEIYAGKVIALLHTEYYQLPGPYSPYGYLYFRKDVDPTLALRAAEQEAEATVPKSIYN